MEQLKAQRLTNTQRHSLLQEVESDSMVQSLDAQLQELIKVGGWGWNKWVAQFNVVAMCALYVHECPLMNVWIMSAD